ncbi:MAG: asparagine synthase-related protein, partial [Alphaproteobacteria bacterium]
PLFYAGSDERLALSGSPARLLQASNLSAIDPTAALSVAMAGYTIGRDTLYQGLNRLGPGEFLLADPSGTHDRQSYHRYSPWRIAEKTAETWQSDLAQTTRQILQHLAEDLRDRTIAIPLSAGLDSRLIVSGLAELGVRNVKCFAYGLPGNYEAKASRRIAEHLGYPWQFVPFTPRSQRAFAGTGLYRDYLAFADNACATPVVHDLPAICAVRESGFLDADAVIVNGNSGDYISGLHISKSLRTVDEFQDPAAARSRVLDAITQKHFQLWDALATPDNLARISQRLGTEFDALPPEATTPQGLHGAYEALELQDRQSKYVIARQRIYEFLGLEWRLPLWDDAYLDFWQQVPLAQKASQSLYRDFLHTANWGGVWQGSEWQFPHRVEPAWIRAPRQLLRLAHAPFGKTRWHRFERRYLSYWMDVFAWQAIVPYRQVMADRRGARHLVSWHTQAYLNAKGLTYGGTPS